MIRCIALVLLLSTLTGCSSKEPTPQDIFRTSKGINVQSFQTLDDVAVVKFTAGADAHEIALSCEVSRDDGPEVPFLDRLLTRIKDNFILIAAAIALL